MGAIVIILRGVGVMGMRMMNEREKEKSLNWHVTKEISVVYTTRFNLENQGSWSSSLQRTM